MTNVETKPKPVNKLPAPADDCQDCHSSDRALDASYHSRQVSLFPPLAGQKFIVGIKLMQRNYPKKPESNTPNCKPVQLTRKNGTSNFAIARSLSSWTRPFPGLGWLHEMR